MADDWCCKGTDPSCDGPQECANRAALLIEAQQDEIERLRAAFDECGSCGALIAENGRNQHERFHDYIDEIAAEPDVADIVRPPLMVRCAGSLGIGHQGTFPPFLGSAMCAMCGQTYRTQDDGTVPEHDRMDVLAMVVRGDYG